MKPLKLFRRVAALVVLLFSLTARTPAYAAPAAFETTPVNWKLLGFIVGAILLLFGMLFALLALRKKRKKNSVIQGVNLEEFLEQWGKTIPFATAIKIITPILKQLASAHSHGLCHLDIYPNRILLEKTMQGYLLSPRSVQEKNQLMVDTAFSAPEQSQATPRLGAWTDVYSITAILFFMITGKKPQGVLQRRLEGDTYAKALDNIGMNDACKLIIESGLAVSESLRPQNALELLHVLKIEYNPVRENGRLKQKKRVNPLKVRKVVRFVMSAIFALAILPLAYLGGWKIIQYHYDNAITYLDAKKYDAAYSQWRMVPLSYKDAAQLGQYLCANIEIDYKNFDSAKTRFEQLGNYRNSVDMIQDVDYQAALYALDELDFYTARKMFQDLRAYKDSKAKLLEVDYQEALEYLNQREFKEAESMFQTLASKKYSDSEAQAKEARYRWAQQYFDNGFYAAALSKMESIDGYKDSSALRKKMVESIYEKGREAYHNSEFATAFDCFDSIRSFGNSESYLTLLEAKSTHFYEIYENYENTKLLFNRLKQISFFEDAKELLVNDVFIYYKLEGNWKNGNNYISLIHKKDGWSMTHTMPGFFSSSAFDLANSSVYFGNPANGWKKVFDLTFDSEDHLTLFCLKNNNTYHLLRN